MNYRNENQTVRDLFTSTLKRNKDARYVPHVRYYNDLRTTGRRRIFKTTQDVGVVKAWLKVMNKLDDSKWQLWESSCGYEVGIMCREAK